MRICIVTVAGFVHGIGGMQDHTVDLIRGLVAEGHDVEAIAPRHPDGILTTEHDGAIWHFVDAQSRRDRFPTRHPAWLRESARVFASIHSERPFDVVHSESTSALGLIRDGWHRRVPIVVKFHGNYLTFATTALRRVARREGIVREAKGLVWMSAGHFLTRGNWYAFRPLHAMVPSSTQLDDTVRAHLLRRSRVHVVPNGIDAAAFAPRDRTLVRAALGLDDRPRFVWLGRVYAGKGLDVAIDAVARVESATLLVVGDGESRQELEARAARLGVADRVDFAGAQPRERMPDYLAAADALVFPSLLPEAAPLTPLQAMSCGLPVLATSVGAVPELIDQPGRNGLLVPPGDVDSLAGAMARLAADESLRVRIGRAARDRVLAEYTLERMVERTLRVYGTACAEFAGPRTSSS